MSYQLIPVDEVPPNGRRTRRVPPGFYDDIIERFIDTGYPKARVDVPGKNPDTVHRRLSVRIESDSTITVHNIGEEVYLINHALE